MFRKQDTTKAYKILADELGFTHFQNRSDFRLRQSLQGFILGLFKQNNYEPLNLDFLEQKVNKVGKYLRRRGKPYKFANLIKSIVGALHPNVFNRFNGELSNDRTKKESDIWYS